jgi:DNA (cytosine-5)-methyltransferase 1
MRSGKAGGGKGALVAEDMSATLKTVGEPQALFPGNGTVRRLTPLECERLQGFPDNWTRVPFKGKTYPSNNVRYKALGNSMAVPVMRWIGEGISIVDREMRLADRLLDSAEGAA